jgi:hypothetical protein
MFSETREEGLEFLMVSTAINSSFIIAKDRLVQTTGIIVSNLFVVVGLCFQFAAPSPTMQAADRCCQSDLVITPPIFGLNHIESSRSVITTANLVSKP